MKKVCKNDIFNLKEKSKWWNSEHIIVKTIQEVILLFLIQTLELLLLEKNNK